jgi:hypothetical protein
MKKKFYLFVLALVLPTILWEANGQLLFKVKYDHDNENWGVFVKPDQNYTPSAPAKLYPGSGQVTIVVPTGYQIGNVKSYNGLWVADARSNRPYENWNMDYLHFGFQANFPPLSLQANSESLLFTFDKISDCPDTLYLIDNDTDPFMVFPNSAGNNPGMDFLVYDSGNGATVNYSGIYAPTEWNCDRIIPTSGFGNIPLEEFRIYYNRGMEQIHIIYPDGETKVEILDKKNDVMVNRDKFRSTESISTKSLEKGYYTLRLTKDGQTILKEILID